MRTPLDCGRDDRDDRRDRISRPPPGGAPRRGRTSHRRADPPPARTRGSTRSAVGAGRTVGTVGRLPGRSRRGHSSRRRVHRRAPVDGDRQAALVRSRLDATRSLVAGIERAASRPQLLISASAVAPRPRGDERLTEASAPGHDFLATLCVDWETHARSAEALGVRVVTLRSGLVLAPGGGALQPMLLPFRLGIGGPLGSGRRCWPWILPRHWLSLVAWLLHRRRCHRPPESHGTSALHQRRVLTHARPRVLHRPCVFRAPAFALRAAAGELADALMLTGQRATRSGRWRWASGSRTGSRTRARSDSGRALIACQATVTRPTSTWGPSVPAGHLRLQRDGHRLRRRNIGWRREHHVDPAARVGLDQAGAHRRGRVSRPTPRTDQPAGAGGDALAEKTIPRARLQ